jgi:hypothetical protein
MPHATKPVHTPEQLSSLLKGFWTPARKAAVKEYAAANGGDYGAAIKAVWEEAGAKEEFKAEYAKAVASN